MATGILGRTDFVVAGATTNTIVYTVPAATFSVVTVNVCNRSGTSVTVRLALSDSGSPSDADYIEYDTEVLANGVLERSGLVLQAGKNVVVRSSSTAVSAVVVGIETSTA